MTTSKLDPTCQCPCHRNGGFGCEYCSTFHAAMADEARNIRLAFNAHNMPVAVEPRPEPAAPTVSKLGVEPCRVCMDSHCHASPPHTEPTFANEAPPKPRKRKRQPQMYAPFKRTTPFGVTPGKYERVTMADGTPYPPLTKQRAIHRYQDMLIGGIASDLRVVKEAK